MSISITKSRISSIRALGVTLALALPFIAPASASADSTRELAKVSELRDAAIRARGPFVYAALRKLWRQWDQGDPAAVEEALDEIAKGKEATPPARAYAGLLEAYARRRRGDIDGAKARVAELGFVSQWLVVGPFDNEGKAGFARAFGPETETTPPDLSHAYEGKERAVKWRAAPNVFPFGWLDLGALVRPHENACAYAMTFAHDQKMKKGESRAISIWAGSAGAIQILWNGKQVLSDDKYRALDADRLAANVTLKAGENRLLVKACGDDDAPMLSVRLAGADGSPDTRIVTQSDLGHAAEAFAQKEGATPQRVQGPLEAFEKSSKGGDAATLEAYARYMTSTGSDDPTEHLARDLASKAAEKAPTIPRLLLAGELAESRNQQAIWIEKAEALAKKGGSADEKLEVLLARADHEQSGTTWRAAVPFYDRVLAIDPDNVTATLARFDLFEDAGLHETALAFLQKALDRKPRSVALLGAMVASLRQADRTTESQELEERYAQVRFDDAAFVKSHIELALAQRSPKEAARWVDRYITTNPDSATALQIGAHSYQLMGDRSQAIGLLKRSLDLAPEDTDAMHELADAYGLDGKRDDQLRLMRQILVLKPQDKDVREYLANAEPAKPRADEVYAIAPDVFLKKRNAPAAGQNKRTLVDLQVTTVFPNGLASRFHQIVFQPLSDAAASEAREYGFSFEADSEAVQLRGARVYHANGQTEDATESGEGDVNDPSIAMYTSARAYYVHFPRLSPGDVVEVKYRVEDVASRNEFADYFGEVTYMQSSEPIGHAEYVLITPKSRQFYFNKPNVPGLTQSTTESKDNRVFRFVAENVPPIEPEALQPPYAELLGHVHVSTYKDWNAMGQWYWGLVKDQFVADDEVRRRVADVTKGLKTNDEKVRAIYDYVVQKTRYVALEFGIHGFKPYRCAQIFARGFGDCKDKATLIVTMLKEAGIPATIVVVRTGLKGDFETFPASLAPFDHAIAYVPSMDLYLDGTAEYTGSRELPDMDRGALALQVNEGKPKLVHLPDPPASENVMARSLDATLATDGTATLDWKSDIAGAEASSWRARYHAAGTRKERIQEDLGRDFAGLEVSQVDTNDLDNVEVNALIHVKGKAPQFARKEGERWSVAAGPAEHMVHEYAELAKRKLEIRIYGQATTVSDWTLHVPAQWKIETMPEGHAAASSPFGSYEVAVSSEGNAVHVKTTVAITRSRIPVAEYPAFRAWCEAVDRALGQRLIMRAK
ncbi:MAG: DUF3857 domain-containing protein [Polyangiaceae bacterium]